MMNEGGSRNIEIHSILGLLLLLGCGLWGLGLTPLPSPMRLSIQRGENLEVKFLPIVYGIPSGEAFELALKEEIALGGCVVTGYAPKWLLVLKTPWQENKK